MVRWTVAEVKRLFTGSRSLEAMGASTPDYEELTDLLNSGVLLASKETYRPTPEPANSSPQTAERRAYEEAHRTRGNLVYSLLRWWAWNWLRRKGEITPFYDYPAGEDMADVCAPSLGIAAKCGDYDPRTIINILKQDDWQALALFSSNRVVTMLALPSGEKNVVAVEYEVHVFTAAKDRLRELDPHTVC